MATSCLEKRGHRVLLGLLCIVALLSLQNVSRIGMTMNDHTLLQDVSYVPHDPCDLVPTGIIVSRIGPLNETTSRQNSIYSKHKCQSSSQRHQQQGQPKDAQGLDMDTSIIITSNLIPSHPSIHMINQTIHSLHHLKGLSPEAPIYITVDFPNTENPSNESLSRLDGYVFNLSREYQAWSNIHILQSTVHRHISGSLHMAMDHIHTTYIYLIQHDFPFAKDIDHTNLRKSLEEYPQFIRNVRFEVSQRIGRPKGQFGKSKICPEWMTRWNISLSTPADHVNGLDFVLLRRWSDNNQFATKAYYEELLEAIGPTPRSLESSQINMAGANCSYYGQHVYGKFKGEGRYIVHLDGLQSTKASTQ